MVGFTGIGSQVAVMIGVIFSLALLVMGGIIFLTRVYMRRKRFSTKTAFITYAVETIIGVSATVYFFWPAIVYYFGF
jgi:hypothetical protein